jgi:predicted choloylglycine hydrolase
MMELVGGGDLEARFLSLYCPPPYISACSQAAWTGTQPALLRNYDYSPALYEGLLWRTAWNGRGVIAMSDCLIGALDGVNDAGLAVSLSFGGSQEVGEGFGAPLLVRYLLEFCSSTGEASAVLRQVPVHMAYNILILDRDAAYVTAFTYPGQRTLLRHARASTNHQDRTHWPRHAAATGTLERERRLLGLLKDRHTTDTDLIAALLHPPLYQTGYDHGYGTLYTAVYRPALGSVSLHWPGDVAWAQRLSHFAAGSHAVALGD